MTENEENRLPYEIDDTGRFRALLPSGKRPVIKPVLADKIRRIYEEFEQPEIPQRILEVPDTGMGQKMDDTNDPEYVRALTLWYLKVQKSLYDRFVLDAIVVPDDNEWAWKMAETGVTIPEDGSERQRAYVEEVLEEIITDGTERQIFIDAVRAISVPTEAGIRAARRRFWHEVDGDTPLELEVADGNGADETGVPGAGGSEAPQPDAE